MRKSVFKLLSIVLLSFTVYAFSLAAIQPANNLNTDISLQDDETVYTVVDKMPQFPGGEGELMKFVNKTIEYPESAKLALETGRVVASFTVEKDGSITDCKIVRGLTEALDKEAINVLKKMPKWTPGEQKGKPVRVRYTLPVVFRL